MHLAVEFPKAVEALLNGKANPNARDDAGCTPLHIAAEGKGRSIETAKLLLQKGADANARNNWKGTPLHRAAEYGAAEIVEILIEAGADPSAKDAHGQTPTDWATARKHQNIIDKLKQAIK